jgi:uncharacterized membrane protein
MNERRLDLLVAVLVAVIVLSGAVLAWQSAQQPRTMDGMMGSGSMMDSPMGSTYGANPLVSVLGAVTLAILVGGLYLVFRDDITTTADGASRPDTEESSIPESTVESATASGTETTPDSPESVDRPDDHSGAQILDVLPEDERRILEPVVASPGLTQIELRDRSAFSKSKVSQTVSELEQRGLLYREPQGRTYRVYPSDQVTEST